MREASVVSPESQDVFPVSKTFTDKYSDMYVITVKKFEKNLKVTSEWQKPQEGETIIEVLVKVKNNGKHFKWAFEVEFSLKDYTGYTYSCIFPPIANHKVFEDANLAP